MSAYYPTELPIQPKLPRPQDTREQRFDKFDDENPFVFEEIKRRARAEPAGKILHMRRIIEDIREDEHIFINNNHAPFYVDKLERDCPELRGRFRKRARTERKMKRVYCK